MFREQAERADCALTLDAEEAVPGCWDPLRIEQVISNLIGNSIKYAAGTPIVVRVRRAAGEAIVSVSDEGPGIAEADLERIFRRFERAASLRNYGGLGLGLFISRTVVEGHGGRIEVDTGPGKGTTFTVHLPR